MWFRLVNVRSNVVLGLILLTSDIAGLQPVILIGVSITKTHLLIFFVRIKSGYRQKLAANVPPVFLFDS